MLAGAKYAIDTGGVRNRMIVIGTPVHFASFIQEMIENHDRLVKEGKLESFSWKLIVYRATQPHLKGGVLWHSRKPRSVLNKLKQEAIDEGNVGRYYQEIELEVQSEDYSRWTRQHYQFHKGVFKNVGGDIRKDGINILVINGEEIIVNTFIGGDPATDIDSETADFSSLHVIAVDKDNRRFGLDSVHERSMPSSGLRNKDDKLIGRKGFVDHYIELYDKYHCRGGGIEDVAMNRSVFQDLDKRKIITGKHYIVANSIKPAGTNKHNRIYSGLNSFFTQGLIYLREIQYVLIDQIIKFGARMTHDDSIEAFYIANRVAYPVRDSAITIKRNKETEELQYQKRRKKKKAWYLQF